MRILARGLPANSIHVWNEPRYVGLLTMDHLDKSKPVFQHPAMLAEGLRRLFPACDEALPAKMEDLLHKLEDEGKRASGG
jgi:hypothetical protein